MVILDGMDMDDDVGLVSSWYLVCWSGEEKERVR
jgi:hypothetical protein